MLAKPALAKKNISKNQASAPYKNDNEYHKDK